ncbi:MAG: hypothetical protein RBS99_05220 [Rhodospirillales bacterium]|jgi:hypothetical protein|nr:hypothetical protein [Rhodospirillales bacterium]
MIHREPGRAGRAPKIAVGTARLAADQESKERAAGDGGEAYCRWGPA